MEKKNKSKYLRDGSEPKSKYIKPKEKKEKKESKSKDIFEAPEYRDSVLTPKRAREMLLEEERIEEEARRLEAEEAAELPVEEFEITASPETETSAQSEAVENAENTAATTPSEEAQVKSYHLKSASSRSENRRRKVLIRSVVCTVVLLVFAELLYNFKLGIPFLPSLFSVEFSALPELIASIAYGPLTGVAVCVIKNLFHMVLRQGFIVSDVNNILLDSVFIVIAGVLYSRSMFAGDRRVKPPKGYGKRGYRRKRIFISSLAGLVISLIPQFFITRYIAFPLLEKFYKPAFTMSMILGEYQNSMAGLKSFLPAAISRFLPEITSVSKGIIFFNLSVTFVKLFFVTVITAIIYKYISPVLHNRKEKH